MALLRWLKMIDRSCLEVLHKRSCKESDRVEFRFKIDAAVCVSQAQTSVAVTNELRYRAAIAVYHRTESVDVAHPRRNELVDRLRAPPTRRA